MDLYRISVDLRETVLPLTFLCQYNPSLPFRTKSFFLCHFQEYMYAVAFGEGVVSGSYDRGTYGCPICQGRASSAHALWFTALF